MSREINFLAERQKGISKQEQKDLRWLKIVALIFGGTCFITAILLVVSLYFSSQLNRLKTQEQAIREQILQNQENEGALVTYMKKLSTLAGIYRDRQDKNDVITFFSSLFGSDAVISGIDFDQKDKFLRFRVESSDVFVLHHVLDVANSQEVKSKYPALALSVLQRKDDASYEITISIPLSKRSVPGG